MANLDAMINKAKANYKEQLIAFLIFFFAIGAIWKIFKKDTTDKEVYSIAWITKVDSVDGGFLATLGYNFEGQEYQVGVKSKHGSESIGKAYFIKLLSKEPTKIIFLEDNRVPDCLLEKKLPSAGWEKIPGCP